MTKTPPSAGPAPAHRDIEIVRRETIRVGVKTLAEIEALVDAGAIESGQP
jgi:hypothetical protein